MDEKPLSLLRAFNEKYKTAAINVYIDDVMLLGSWEIGSQILRHAEPCINKIWLWN